MTVFEQWARVPQRRPAAFVVGTIALLIALTWLIYHRTFDYGYLDWDDNTLVEQNIFVTDPTTERVKATFTPNRVPGPHLPLRSFSYIVDLQVFAKDLPLYCPRDKMTPDGHCTVAIKPNWHHINNTWLYALNGILLFLILRKLIDPWAAAIASVVFIAHPIHVEAVSWVSGRKEMLSGAFILGGLLAYVTGTERQSPRISGKNAGISLALSAAGVATTLIWYRWGQHTAFVYGLVSLGFLVASALWLSLTSGAERSRSSAVLLAISVVSTLAALLSKPVAIAIPPILLAWEIGYRPHARKAEDGKHHWIPSLEELRGITARLLPHVLLMIWGMWMTMGRAGVSQVLKDDKTWNAAPTSRLKAALSALWLDVYHLVAPLELSALYDVKSDKWYWTAIAGAVLLVAIPALALWVLRKSPKSLLWIAFFVFPLLPVSGIIPIAAIHADRYLYLPAIALAVALGVLLATAAFGDDAETGMWERWMSAALCIAIVGGFTVLSIKRTHTWSEDHLLWGDAVRNNPDLASARNNYGAALMNKNRVEEALKQYYKAYDLIPTLDVAQFNIAATEFRLGRPEKAMKYAEEFVGQHPEMPTGWILLGQIYQAQQRQMQQQQLPVDVQAKKLQEAENAYRKGCGVNVDPVAMLQRMDKASACNQLAILLASRADIAGAEKAFAEALAASPNNRQVRLNKVRFLRQQKRFDEALRELDALAATSQIDVELARAYAGLHYETKDYVRAKEYAEMLVRNPRGVPPQDVELKNRIDAALGSAPIVPAPTPVPMSPKG